MFHRRHNQAWRKLPSDWSTRPRWSLTAPSSVFLLSFPSQDWQQAPLLQADTFPRLGLDRDGYSLDHHLCCCCLGQNCPDAEIEWFLLIWSSSWWSRSSWTSSSTWGSSLFALSLKMEETFDHSTWLVLMPLWVIFQNLCVWNCDSEVRPSFRYNFPGRWVPPSDDKTDWCWPIDNSLHSEPYIALCIFFLLTNIKININHYFCCQRKSA